MESFPFKSESSTVRSELLYRQVRVQVESLATAIVIMKISWASQALKRSPEDELAFMRSQLKESRRILKEQQLLMERQQEHEQAMTRYIEEMTKQGHWGLKSYEEWWTDRTKLFWNHGFMLPERLRPNWEPSWLGTSKHPGSCEDGRPLPVSTCRSTPLG